MDCEKHFYVEYGQVEGMQVITHQGPYPETECPHCRIEILRDEMKAIALALGRSKTDGESDCDWYDMAGEVQELRGAIGPNLERARLQDRGQGIQVALDVIDKNLVILR